MPLRMTHSGDTSTSPPARIVRAIFAALALLSLLCGLALYLFAERLGLDQSSARLIATAFLVAGVLDALVVYGWGRLFKPRG